jgi:hypothetical protein
MPWHKWVDVTHGLALLFGIGTGALRSQGIEPKKTP